MRRPILLIFANACILIVAFVLLAQSLFIVQRVAQTQSVAGRVMVQRGGEGDYAALAQGAPVQSGDVVTTGTQSSAEFTWQDGTRWKMNPNSQLRIEKSLFNSLKKDEVSRFHLEKGQLLVRVVKNLSPTSRFEVETPDALIAVRGTIFSVSAQRGATRVGVFKGQTEVSAGEETPRFSALTGQTADVSASGVKISTSKNQNEFFAARTLLLPALEVETRALPDGATYLKGHTEVGNRVLIDGERVTLLGNGVFVKRMATKIPVPHGGWKIQSTDKYGATSQVFKSPIALSAPAPFKPARVAPATPVNVKPVSAEPITQCP